LPPASLTKLLTAVIAAQTLQPADTIAVSARAAGEPARKIGMKAGEVWPFQDALHCLLLSSANDAAAAIGERIGGSLENFAVIMSAAGRQLGLADNPVLQDPAGLDDNFSVAGGNLLSARDLAIIARAALAQRSVAAAVATDVYSFVGPDGTHHRLTNHIHSFLTTYPGAIGLKPGLTQRAGPGLALAARRNGRTLIAIVLNAPDTSASAIGLLDKGFAMPATAAGTGDVLPAVNLPANALAPAPSAAPAAASPAVVSPPPKIVHSSTNLLLVGGAGLLVFGPFGLAISARRREIKRRKARRLAGRQT
jgi:D-alanyl-D-alanine carboxypeptidase (penicillin-binding protein 5/6)